MARKLPWERVGGNARPASKLRQSASSTRRSFSPGPSTRPSDRGDKDSNRGRAPKQQHHTRPDTTGRYRSPTSSPPPAPPTESFMIDGLDNDDRYRMVEDELLAVAHIFTAHLHAAEYQRLRARAKSQSTALQSLARPVTTVITTERVVRRNAVTKQRAKQNAALRAFKGIPDTSDTADANDKDKDMDLDEPQTGSILDDLMKSDQRKAPQSLVSLAPVAANISASQSRAPQTVPDNKYRNDDDDDSDDDLDGPILESVSATLTPAILPEASRLQRALDMKVCMTGAASEKKSVSFAPKTRQISIGQDEETFTHQKMDNDFDDTDDDLGTVNLLQSIWKRREREKVRRQEEQQQRRQAATAQQQGSRTEPIDIIPP
ncbi:hypothetical protein SEPCBS57363_002221 [Sporothrix epigloea]|uniref:Uncharacterized protein n=1 Tax=Sporothrix epigloea TaxID=1892477 RepID=A0ABP0DGA5_9PEZI